MPRKFSPTTGTINGLPAFPQLTIQDLINIGLYAQAEPDAITQSMVLMPGSAGATYGGNLVLIGGLGIEIFAPLMWFRPSDGKRFEFIGISPQIFTLQTADLSNPRIDIVYATIGEGQASAAQTRHYKVDPTNPGSQEGDQSTFSESWDMLTIGVVTGTPNVSPQVPALPANSVLLYTITVQANETNLTATDVTDNRHILETLEALGNDVALLKAQVNTLQSLMPFINADHVRILAGAGQFSFKTAQDAFAILANLSDQTNYDPLTMPQVLTADGRVGALPNQDTGGLPVVDIPVGAALAGVQIAFSNGVRVLNKNSIPSTQNPRLVNLNVNQAAQTQTNTTALSTGVIQNINSTGGGNWAQKNAHAPSKRQNSACAARDAQFIEVFGGNAGFGASLSDWWTYDTLADTVTVRGITSGPTPPACDNPAMFSCGDGVHVLLGCASTMSIQSPRWFLINAQTGASVEVFNGPVAFGGQSYQGFLGGLVQPGVIVILAQTPIDNSGPFIQTVWKYDINAGTFTQLTTTGIMPKGYVGASDACLYQNGQLIVVNFSAVGLNASGQTFIFNYPSLSWTQLNITEPANPFTASQAPIQYFRLRNFGGKVYLVGGSQALTTPSGTQTAFWQLVPGNNPVWTEFPSTLPNKWLLGMASTISGGLQQGTGFAFCGKIPGASPPYTDDIWIFGQTGIINTLLGTTPGITLAPGTTQATFSLAPIINLPWQVATLLATLAGGSNGPSPNVIPPGTVLLSYSFDGVNFQAINKDVITAILNAAIPSPRYVNITMISQGSVAPILTSLTELFESAGGPSFSQLVLRYDCPAGTRALYMNRDGSMLFSPNINPSTPDIAILIKTVFNGNGNNPSVKNYRNLRRLRFKYTGTKANDVDPTFDYDGAVAPTFVDARAVVGGPNARSTTWTVSPNCTSFTLTYGAQTTASQTTAGLTAAALQAALAALSSIGAHNVIVTGANGGPFTVVLYGSLANTVGTALTSTPTGGAALCPVVLITAGNSGVNYKLPDPSVVFDTPVTVVGMGLTNDGYIVEVSN
jgi:hypothetical protein